MVDYEKKGAEFAKKIVQMDKSIRKKHIMAKIKIDAFNKKVKENGKR